MSSTKSMFEDSTRPLADMLRPKTLADVLGQAHLVGKDGLITKLLNSDGLTNLILWGPPGSGKTTLARIIANESEAHFAEISAVSMGKAAVVKVIDEAKVKKTLGEKTILFVDEIHRFNKAQQDAFLPFVEDGTIILIGATTENPSFEVISPLLSRSTVAVLDPLTHAELVRVIDRAIKTLKNRTINKEAKELLAHMAAGDARAALTGLEMAAQLSKNDITVPVVEQAMQQVGLKYDKKGDEHYNTISAFIKSMRGSDVDASLFYLFRMLAAGEDPKFVARRLVIFASEDVGMASPHALTLATSAFLAVERVGLPEGEYILAQATIAMAKSEKSRAVADAMSAAKKAVLDNPHAVVPKHLRNAPTKLMKDLGYNQDYKWQADFKHDKGFLPEELAKQIFYKEK